MEERGKKKWQKYWGALKLQRNNGSSFHPWFVKSKSLLKINNYTLQSNNIFDLCLLNFKTILVPFWKVHWNKFTAEKELIVSIAFEDG